MQNKNQLIIGIIGSGRLGTAIAKLATQAGYTVNIANSRGPHSMELVAKFLIPGVNPQTIGDIILLSDIIIFAIPLGSYKKIDKSGLQGKIVIDAMNYWPPTEGKIAEFESAHSTSEYLQDYFVGSFLVKTFNHVAYGELDEDSSLNTPGSHRAIALAGNDSETKKKVEQFIQAIGFEPVDLGDLSKGILFQPDTKLFNVRFNKYQMLESVKLP